MTYLADDTDSSGAPATSERAGSRRALGCAFEVVETLVLTLLIYLVIHNFVAQPFEVRMSSMTPTIVEHEYVLIDKISPRFADYQRGDVVVFQPPADYQSEGDIPFIKRVIGLPGETVQLINGAVWVTAPGGSATRLDEPYVARAGGATVPTTCPPADCTGTWEVPDGEFFVMGDNRGASQDSRVFGPIVRDSIIGRAWVRYFPVDRIGVVGRPDGGYPGLPDRAGEEAPDAAATGRAFVAAAP
jgi:signal peptidase I